MTNDDTVTNTEQLEKQQNPKTKLKLKKVKDQVIVITGATSGIGLVTARMAAEKGAKVVAAARNEDALQELVDEVKKKGHEAIYVKADVGKEEDVNRIAETAISTFGRFDTWVNNAAVSVFGHAMDVTAEDMKRVFDTNFWGPVYGTRAAVKHFTSRGGPGALINVGSLFGDRGTVIQSTYASAKFALHGWTESIRMELEKEQAPVSVTLIHPGRIDTPYNEHARSYLDKQPAHYRSMIYPPEAAAEAILFAAEHPKRDMYIGSQAKAIAMLGALFPRLTDRLMEKIMYYSQHAERPSKPREESALYHAGYGMHDRGTNKGWLRSRSYYVKATKRPAVTAAAAVGLACVWAAVKRTK
ncbi:SDR family oxidoreductase [Bacillus halotolerans]|uniref:SDR family oxidoreductase n=1 Tax=Bacillus halotolerans TaxID=260554 RepID=UPI00227DC738|nr:SDR family oxidoreductase [Bacillus halotolerans]MCY8979893.1 SDR family oxidoreductase [Bacillus halotolerans]MEC1661951.1 SDR family oxidoreductase [Bacillus halotolerans]